MKALIVYDSLHGNTEQIAKAIGGALKDDVRIERVGSVDPTTLDSAGVLIIGSPTHGGRPTPAMQKFIDAIPEKSIKGMRVAAFDTRLAGRMVRMFGYAAPRAAASLESMGAVLVLPPEGFAVAKTTGPLKDGELERAAKWAKGLRQ